MVVGKTLHNVMPSANFASTSSPLDVTSSLLDIGEICSSACICSHGKCQLLSLPVLQAGELIAHSFHAVHGLSVTGLRFSAIYGPWTRPDTAPFKFAVSIMKGQPIPIYAVRRWLAVCPDHPAM